MPSTYAHYRMGQEVKNSILGKEKRIVDANEELFNIGLHGPDILFYYHPLSTNRVNSIGYGMHEKPGRDFFENAAMVVQGNSDKEAHMAYVYGFICHFALDVTCHGYIDEKIKSSGVSHAEIEVEFDRELMVKDGLNPIKHRLTNHIIASEKNAYIIKDFFSGITTQQVITALHGMINNNNLLLAPSKFKRFMIYTLLRVTGNYKEMHGLMVNFEKNSQCDDSTEHLMHLYNDARRLAIKLIIDYQNFMLGNEPLENIYRYTFGSKLIDEIGKEGCIDEIQIN